MVKNNVTSWSISSDLIREEAEKLWMEFQLLSKNKNLFYLKKDGKRVLFKNIECWLNSALGFKLSEDKELTYLLLQDAGIPVPRSIYLQKDALDNLDIFPINIPFPLVSKPVDGSHGDGVIVNIQNQEELRSAIQTSFDFSDMVIVQNFISWSDHRVLVVGDEVIAVAKRLPASVVGDGKSTLRELVKNENKNPLRIWWDHTSPLSPIKLDHESLEYLTKNWYSDMSIPEVWKRIFLRGNANLSTGGTSIDLTDTIHPSVWSIAVLATKLVWLEIAGVDIITSDISKPLTETGGVIIEINATPWLRMHHYPFEGVQRNVSKAILRRVFNL
jgi:cyanophycin synthetase